MHSSRFGRLTPFIPVLAVSFLFGSPFAAAAQSDSLAADGSGVARISLIDGTVDIQRGDADGTLAAVVNAPVLGGDYLTTGDASRSEVQFDGSAQLRLSQDAQLRFTRLDTGNRTLQLAQGTIEMHLSRADGTNEIDTPSIAIKPRARGAYRVTVDSDGQTQVTVRSGRAEIETPHGAQTIGPGTTLIAQGAASDPSIQTVAAIEPDAFDAFNAQRDRRYERSFAASQYVNADIDGVDDLDANGRWVNDGSYGQVWTPAAVGPEWAPYRDGRWVWEDGYGWTWVAAEAWGWAPYHYGNWYHSPNYGWCWYPPQPRVYTPWRPALVAFFGFGGGSGLSLNLGGGGFGNIGWVPLAPFEPYHPWWHNGYGNGGNVTNINTITNTTNITNVTNVNVYKNVQYNAVSSVTSERFLQGRFERNTPVRATELRDARVFRGAMPVVPTASNLRFADSAAVRVARTPLVQRSFAGNTAVVRRTAFGEQRTSLATTTHVALTPLHYKDAQTTPIAPRVFPPRTTDPAGSAARLTGEHHTAAVPSYAAPQQHRAGSDPWARFNQSRALTTNSGAARVAAPHASVPVRRPLSTQTGAADRPFPSTAVVQPAPKLQRRTPANADDTITTTTGVPAYARPQPIPPTRRIVPTDSTPADVRYRSPRTANDVGQSAHHGQATLPHETQTRPRKIENAPPTAERPARNVQIPQHTTENTAAHSNDVHNNRPPRERSR